VLAVDEAGFLKKRRMSAGVARMYTCTAGSVENCLVAVFAAYVTADGGRALIDRELCLPEKWTDDRCRCRAAGIGDERRVRDEARAGAEDDRPRAGRGGPAGSRRAACRRDAVSLVPKDRWQRLSCANGSKGPRLYDCALIGTAARGHRLLVRRSLQPGEKGQLELACFRRWSPRPVTLPARSWRRRYGIRRPFARQDRTREGTPGQGYAFPGFGHGALLGMVVGSWSA